MVMYNQFRELTRKPIQSLLLSTHQRGPSAAKLLPPGYSEVRYLDIERCSSWAECQKLCLGSQIFFNALYFTHVAEAKPQGAGKKRRHGAPTIEGTTPKPHRELPFASTLLAEILEGKHDQVREDQFYMVGGIDEIVGVENIL